MQITQFQQTQFSSLFEEQSVQLIERGLHNGTIRFIGSETDIFFQRMSFLPTNTNRLAWERIENISLHPPDGYFGSQAQRSIQYGKQLKELMQSLSSYFEITTENGLLFEDHFADGVLELTYGDFVQLDVEFLYTPGHKYFLASNSQWLLNITMEGDMYFSQRISEYLQSH